MKNKPLTILYLISPSHSGSTLLSLLLGTQPELFCGGELDIFSQAPQKASRLKERLCSCHQIVWSQCPFWLAVDQELKNTHRLSLATLDVEAADPVLFKNHNQALFEVLQKVSGKNIIVDSSKRVERFVRLRDAGFKIAPVRLQRRAAAVVYSWINRNEQWREADRGHQWWDVAEYYTTFYKTLDAKRPHKSMLSIDYEDLVNQPQSTIAKLLHYVNCDRASIQLDWTQQLHHHLSGNPMRYGKQATIKKDDRWQRGLSFSQKWGIGFITFPTRFDNRFLYQLWRYPIRVLIRLIYSGG